MKRRTFVQALSAIPFVVYVGSIFSKELDPKQGQTLTIPKGIPKNVKELAEFMEQVLPVAPSTETKWSVTGEEYIEYAMKTPSFGNEEKLCKSIWRVYLTKCRKLNENGYKLYWRVKPEYAEYISDFQTPYGLLKKSPTSRIYVRYLISNKSEISDGTRSIGMVS